MSLVSVRIRILGECLSMILGMSFLEAEVPVIPWTFQVIQVVCEGVLLL